MGISVYTVRPTLGTMSLNEPPEPGLYTTISVEEARTPLALTKPTSYRNTT